MIFDSRSSLSPQIIKKWFYLLIALIASEEFSQVWNLLARWRFIWSIRCPTILVWSFDAAVLVTALILYLFLNPSNTLRMRNIVIITSFYMTLHYGPNLTWATTPPFFVIGECFLVRWMGNISIIIKVLFFDTYDLFQIIFNWATRSVSIRGFIILRGYSWLYIFCLSLEVIEILSLMKLYLWKAVQNQKVS